MYSALGEKLLLTLWLATHAGVLGTLSDSLSIEEGLDGTGDHRINVEDVKFSLVIRQRSRDTTNLIHKKVLMAFLDFHV
ncbi:hypothetical protein Tco_0752869 [Tanacetum coccineum]